MTTRRAKQDVPFPTLAGWRLLIALAAGVAVGLTVPLLKQPMVAPHALLAGWDVGALTYIVLMWHLFLSSEEKDIRARAATQDIRSGAIVALVLMAIAASLLGVFTALATSHEATGVEKAVSVAFVIATLVLGWIVLQTVFVAHYAHRHFNAVARNPEHGIGFPGEAPHSYMDFAYLAFSVGATFQVSDNTVGSTRLRNLVTAHGAAAYIYNTAILAVGIGLVVGLLGG
jgi:uncharacterized membrane protein